MKRVQDKVALVTGGAAGIGAAIVRRLVAEGAKVTITDIQASVGEALAKELGCDFLKQDVTDELQWNEIASQVEKRHGALHILVNNAGIEGPFDISNPESTRLADWQKIQRVNVEGVFLGCRAVIPAIRRAGGGTIINMSSTAALGPGPEWIAYSASKATVRHMTTSVALHCAKSGSKIRCNSVHPGVTLTPMMERIAEDIAKRRGITAEQVMNEFKAASPANEFQMPEDIANGVLFLVSQEARCINGIGLVIDGGGSARY